MNEYELFYLVGESKESQLDRIKGEVEALVVAEGGSFVEGEKSEKRKLAYPVRKEIRGTYIAKRFMLADKNAREESVEKGEENPISRMTRQINLYRDVLRFIIIRADELPPLVEKEGAAKVMDDMVKEEKKQKAEVVQKPARKPKAVSAPKVEKEAKVAEEKEAPALDEADIDKKLEEVLNL